MPDPRHVALIGAGYWGRNLARNFAALGVLHTIADLDASTLARYADGFDGVQRTPDIDSVFTSEAISAVAIAAPAVLHHRLAKAALLAGKDVYVEKPLCLDANEAAELIELASVSKRVLMVGHLLQYHPCVEHLLRLVADGELGKLYYVASNRLNLGKIRREENALWSFAPHDISVILALAGNILPDHVDCSGGAYLAPGVADTTLTSLHFPGGLRAHIHVSWLNPFKEQKLTVVGSKGMAVFDDGLAWPDKLTLYRDYITWAGGSVPIPRKDAGSKIAVAEAEPLRAECEHFITCCRQRTIPRTSGREGMRVLQVLQMAQQKLDEHLRDTSASRSPRLAEPPPSAPVGGAAQPPAKSAGYYVHPTAVVDDGARIGDGSKIWHFAHISAGARIGKNCNFGQNTFVADGVMVGANVKAQNNVAIYAGTTIEDNVFLGPSCVLTNVTNPRSEINRRSLYERTLIRRGATIGANATIVCGVTVGRYAFVAAGAVVAKDVPDYGLVAGVPARHLGWMSRHGHRLPAPDAVGISICPESGLRYKLNSAKVLECLDVPEEQSLPSHLAQGSRRYDDYKSANASAGASAAHDS